MNDDRYEQGLETPQTGSRGGVRGRIAGSVQRDDQAVAETRDRVVLGNGLALEGLDRRTRSLITLAMLTALGRMDEIRLHLRGAVNNGCTLEEIREVLLHAAVYCGVPAAVDAFRVLAQEFDESDPNERPAG